MKISNFDLNLFVILNAIYTEGSLTKAAHVVGITQPAVSNALSRLREKFNDELFIRTGSGMIPGISSFPWVILLSPFIISKKNSANYFYLFFLISLIFFIDAYLQTLIIFFFFNL